MNLRDVAAHAPVRPGMLWRSDAPRAHDRRPDGVPGAGDGAPWPPPTVVDLRWAGERREPTHPLAGPGVDLVDVPMSPRLSPEQQTQMDAGDFSLPQLYDVLLDTADDWLPPVVHAAAVGRAPILVHCAAGKDRTGVAVALLLALAGVDDEAIMADYLATNAVLDDPPILVDRLGFADEEVRRRARLLGVSETGMRRVLERIAPDPAAFHRAHGVPDADIERWRERLVAAVTAGDER